MSSEKFEWALGDDPPELKSHSVAKLDVLSDYLKRYFKTVVRDPRVDRLSMSLVDGFCGGGAFIRYGERLPGSPIVMLQAVADAENLLNEGRKKPIKIDATYYFVDREASAIEFLKAELIQHGYLSEIGASIHLLNQPFEKVVSEIVEDIRKRAWKGRSLFFLDQCGWNLVSNSTIRMILENLPKSEVVLTFAVGWLLTYMNDHANFLKACAPIEISEDQIRRYIDVKGVSGGRYLIQRLLLEELKLKTGAPFYTPFFLRSRDAKLDLWLIHISKHPTARNVMTSTHWGVQNSSRHQGPGGLNMLGFDPHWDEAPLLDFLFDDNAEQATARAYGAIARSYIHGIVRRAH